MPASKLTAPQVRVLVAARDKGGAAYATGSRAGGARHRMIDRMVVDGLLGKHGPFPITEKGRKALAAAEKSNG